LIQQANTWFTLCFKPWGRLPNIYFFLSCCIHRKAL
jgi:hypothetical protein